jgi:gamma-glutamyltranspeptidase/glutathione hydrolase
MASAIKTYGSGRFTLGQLITNGGDAKRPPYAYELARDGVTVTWELASSLFCNERRLHYYREAERIYGAGAYGTTLRQPEYASSLLFIARNGPDAFYEDARFPDPITGLPRDSIARMIDADMAAAEDNAKTNPTLLANEDRWGGASNDKGLLTVDDFAAYEPVWRTPLTSMYRGHRIIAMPPPTSGGIATIEILNLLEGFPLGSNALDTSLEANARTSWAQSSANHLHALAEAQKLAFADRNKYVADPDFRYDYEGDGVPDESVPTKTLTSKDYADHRRGEIDMDSASFDYEPGASGPPHTNHLSVIDGQGNAVAVTTSVGAMFGSAVVAPGTGFVLTSQLEDFNMREPEAANAPGPGKRPRSSQSPTIVVKSGKPVLVVGASGGATIPLGVVQAIVNVAAFGLDVAHAIDAGRIEARFYGDRLGIEAPRFADAVLNELAERGHSLQPYLDLFGEETGYYPLPIAEAVGSNLTTGLNEATSDPRNEYDYADSSGSTFGQGACGQGRACGQ